MTSHSAEAHQLIEGMANVYDRLSLPDRRFLTTWQSHLERKGEGAQINPLQHAAIQQRAACYGLCEQPDLKAIQPLMRAAVERA